MGTRLEYDDWGRMIAVRDESLDSLKAVAEACGELRSNGCTGDKEMRHLAEFPGFIIEQYCHNNGIEWNEWFQNPVHARRMLNDPSLAYFRVHEGKV